LFERFHRGSNVDDRRFAGLGLGLYLSRGIAEQHGGRIWATSNPGGGSTFSVSLPLHGVSRTQLQSAFATGVEAPA
jgi:two-component system, OmpR family, sensor histidine kinase VicK